VHLDLDGAVVSGGMSFVRRGLLRSWHDGEGDGAKKKG